MEMELARLTNVSWLRIPDRHVVAMRTAMLTAYDQRPAPMIPARSAPVPALDWPADLFADETSSH